MTRLLFVFTFIMSLAHLKAQDEPVSFNIQAKQDTIIFEAQIEKGWHMYAANLPDPTAGPLPTELIFDETPGFKTKGKIIESKGHQEMDAAFGVEVIYFENKATFKQSIAANKGSKVSGTVYYMICNDEMCVPKEYPFELRYNP